MEKVYANMSACHIKRDNWKRAQETAEKALAKNPKNYKAMFRRAKALGEQGYSERAEKILEELIRQSPSGKISRSQWHASSSLTYNMRLRCTCCERRAEKIARH
jgi:tetratricopeptide (TPR) repeat protein